MKKRTYSLILRQDAGDFVFHRSFGTISELASDEECHAIALEAAAKEALTWAKVIRAKLAKAA